MANCEVVTFPLVSWVRSGVIPDLCLFSYFVLASADKAANNIAVVWKVYYINTQKQELSTAKTY